MMNPVSLYFSFTGRIGRFAYWLGLIILIAISPFSVSSVLTQDPFRDAIAAIQNLGWVGVAWTAALFIPLAALNTKRLHDLGQSGLHAALFYAPAAIGTLKLFVGPSDLFGRFEYWAGWALWAAGAAGIWFLVRLGLFPGTRGDNAYGPPPGSRARQAMA